MFFEIMLAVTGLIGILILVSAKHYNFMVTEDKTLQTESCRKYSKIGGMVLIVSLILEILILFF